MFIQGKYKDKSREEIAKEIKQQGFDPIIIANVPGYTYIPHQHPETKLLVFLEGSMIVSVNDRSYVCHSGDEILIPGNTKHSAKVGKDGCIFFWSEKLF